MALFFSPEDSLKMFNRSSFYLEEKLKESVYNNYDKIVVISHFLPSEKSINKKFIGNSLNPYFCSNLENLMEKYKIDLWIHGHTHISCNYMFNNTRIICNPKGEGDENKNFNERLIIEI